LLLLILDLLNKPAHLLIIIILLAIIHSKFRGNTILVLISEALVVCLALHIVHIIAILLLHLDRAILPLIIGHAVVLVKIVVVEAVIVVG